MQGLEGACARATSVICKALKARVLLLAASPLYNGEFPFRSWRNDTYETPGYGKELVSLTYDRAKWERARKACEEAVTLAESNGQTEGHDAQVCRNGEA